MNMRERSHLGALIEQQKRLNGLSDQGIVDRAQARGERLSKANLSKVASGESPSITRNTIFGLAAGLGVTPATVAKAALGDMGIVITEQDADTETAIRTDPTLPEMGRRVMLTLLREVRAHPYDMPTGVGFQRPTEDQAAAMRSLLQRYDAEREAQKASR